jgi:hypothetical protein
LPRSLWWATALVIALLTAINAAFTPDLALDLSPTSYGRSLDGHGALYDVLGELGFDVARSRAPYASLPTSGQALWLVRPDFAGSLRLSRPDDEDAPGAQEGLLDELLGWVQAGGTAVIVGPDPALLERLELDLADASAPVGSLAQGTLGRRVFSLAGDQDTLAPADGWEAVLQVGSEPFALFKPLGSGHVLVIADAGPFSNDALDDGDHVLLAVDLARAFGAPRFDERCHGMFGDATLASALGARRIGLLAACLGLLAALFLWQQRSVPPAELGRPELPDPSLARFVDSLALLYDRKARAHAAAAYRAYLHGLRHRLRRALYGRGRGSDELLSRRLARELVDDEPLRDALEGRAAPAGVAQLETVVRAMERYMMTALHRRAQE